MATKRLSQAEKRAETRAALMHAARDAFGRRGYHGASLEEIAGEAGFSTGALYYNFASKEALFLALLDERIEERISDIDAAFEQATTSTEATAVQAQDAARGFMETLSESSQWRLLSFEFVAVAARDPALKRQVKKRFERMHIALTDLIDRRRSELGLRLPVASEELAATLAALGNGLAIDAVLGLSLRDEVFGEMVGYLLAGIASAAAASDGKPTSD
jgi:AcrR family transcriptional regulator